MYHLLTADSPQFSEAHAPRYKRRQKIFVKLYELSKTSFLINDSVVYTGELV